MPLCSEICNFPAILSRNFFDDSVVVEGADTGMTHLELEQVEQSS